MFRREKIFLDYVVTVSSNRCHMLYDKAILVKIEIFDTRHF
jgi:hypothetical protein